MEVRGCEEHVMELWLQPFRHENGIIQALCWIYVDEFTVACSDSTFGRQAFDGTNILYPWRTWESRVFKQRGAQITQAYDKHTKTWSRFEISFAEYVKEISLTSVPSHRRRDRKSQISSLELSQLRALNGQLL